MAGEIELTGIVQEQHQRLLAHRWAGMFPVGVLHSGQGGFLPVAQAIEAAQGIPIKELGKRLCGVLGDRGGGGNQPPGASDITQDDRT
jgi:hypothetical protein